MLGATYDIIDLGTLGGSSSAARGINASGQVVGQSNLPGDTASHAFLWSNGHMTDLGTLGGTSSAAFGINNSGQVVGWADLPGQTGGDAFLWSNGHMTDLGRLGGPYSGAWGINSIGQVAGWALTSAGNFYAVSHGFRTAANQPINPATDDLGPLGGTYTGSQALDINDSGQVVGSAFTSGAALRHAFRTAANQPINPATDDLGTLGGTYTGSQALDINDSGQVVGWAETSGPPDPALGLPRHAFRTAANQPINPTTDDLGTLGGTDSVAVGINASGQVVGHIYTAVGNYRAFIYSGSGPMQNLNHLIDPASGWTLEYATAINDSGQIVGGGTHNGLVERAFLMTPIPEPSTFALLAIAAGLLAYAWRRRTQ